MTFRDFFITRKVRIAVITILSLLTVDVCGGQDGPDVVSKSSFKDAVFIAELAVYNRCYHPPEKEEKYSGDYKSPLKLGCSSSGGNLVPDSTYYTKQD